MTEDQEPLEEEKEETPVFGAGLNKAIAIMFVAGIYFIVFLKILFIK